MLFTSAFVCCLLHVIMLITPVHLFGKIFDKSIIGFVGFKKNKVCSNESSFSVFLNFTKII